MNNSLRKAMRVIRLIEDHQGEYGLSDVCKRLDMNKSTVFRYIETLISLHLLEKHQDTYYLGIGLFLLGNKVRTQTQIVDWIHPLLEKLAREVNETVNFAQLHEQTALYLDKAASMRGLQMKAQVGDRLPLYCTALGKAILSSIEAKRLDTLLENLEMSAMTKSTITDRAILQEQLETMRARGYCIEREEFDVELACVAVPLKIPELTFLGGLSISGPIYRLNETRVSFLAEKLLNTRDEIVNAIHLVLGGHND